MTATETILVPRVATLEGFLDVSAAGLDVQTVAPMTTLIVQTRNTAYRIIIGSAGSVFVQGGRFFPDAAPARFDGASAGGSLLKSGWIVVGLCMELTAGGQRIVTSPVRSISDSRPPGPVTH